MNNDLILGIDEAGMGPVFGPLIVSGVVIEKKNIDILKSLGVKDSKKFGAGSTSNRKRKDVWEACKKYIISEKRVAIDAASLDKKNMYELHIEACIKILTKLKWNKMQKVYIEQLGSLKQQNFSSKLGFWNNNFVYEKEADIKYSVVSLASIGAKILRDELVIKLCKNVGENYVSGYANNVTEDFFRRYYNKNGVLPPGTRISRKWRPLIEMLNKK